MTDDFAGEARAVRFGEQPLPQTIAAAGALRRLTGLVLSLEQPHPSVAAMLEQFEVWERELAAAVPPDSAPRVGPESDVSQRVYLDHAFDIGAFNPCFPEYLFERLGPTGAAGRVTFPLVFEGPPGYVHGGFVAVFFDCVTQHQSCAAGLSGKTRALKVTFLRPTPIGTELRFDIERVQTDRTVTSTARLLRNDDVLCVGEFDSIASPPERLAGFGYGRRRTDGGPR